MLQVQSAVAPLTAVIHEIHDELKKHMVQEGERISGMDERFDKHLEIYANNGKEAKRVADNLAKMMDRADARDAKTDEIHRKTEEMYQKFLEERIVAAADKKRLQNIVLYGSVGAALMGIIAFTKWLLR